MLGRGEREGTGVEERKRGKGKKRGRRSVMPLKVLSDLTL